jgi:hypothetical protein
VVGQAGVFENGADGIQAEIIHAQIQPEARFVEHGLIAFRVAPVQVGLAFEEEMIIVFTSVSQYGSRQSLFLDFINQNLADLVPQVAIAAGCDANVIVAVAFH